jgi:hypothetical protein
VRPQVLKGSKQQTSAANPLAGIDEHAREMEQETEGETAPEDESDAPEQEHTVASENFVASLLERTSLDSASGPVRCLY